MPTNTITAGATTDAFSTTGGNDGTLTIQTGPSGAKVNAIVLASDGTPTFLKVPANAAVQSMVRLHTANGYGSTNTKIRRFTTTVTNQGSDITYADSAANGASFTINTAGVYAISYVDNCASASMNMGISLNSTQLTTNIQSITLADVLNAVYTPAANAGACASVQLYLAAGSVVRAHTDGSAAGTPPITFTITRVS